MHHVVPIMPFSVFVLFCYVFIALTIVGHLDMGLLVWDR